MCDKSVDTFLKTLKFVRNWFVINKITETLDDAVFSNDDTVFNDVDSDNAIFFSDDLAIVLLF